MLWLVVDLILSARDSLRIWSSSTNPARIDNYVYILRQRRKGESQNIDERATKMTNAADFGEMPIGDKTYERAVSLVHN